MKIQGEDIKAIKIVSSKRKCGEYKMYDHPHAAYTSFFCCFIFIRLDNTVKMPNILTMVKKFEVINCNDSN